MTFVGDFRGFEVIFMLFCCDLGHLEIIWEDMGVLG